MEVLDMLSQILMVSSCVDFPLPSCPFVQVEKAMRRHVETVEPDESLVNVAKLLRVSSLNALVVVEKGTKDKVHLEDPHLFYGS